jgi:Fic family protein
MEGTISARMEEGATMNKIMEFFSAKLPEPSVTPWCSEGGRDVNTPSSDRQLCQNTTAVKYLLLDNRFSPLSVELIVETHRLLMENSYNLSDHGRTKVPVEVGTVRTTKEVNAGMYQFTPARAVLNATQYLVRQYNNHSNCNHPITLATLLFYELITIHPFENGNGRLCR